MSNENGTRGLARTSLTASVASCERLVGTPQKSSWPASTTTSPQSQVGAGGESISCRLNETASKANRVFRDTHRVHSHLEDQEDKLSNLEHRLLCLGQNFDAAEKRQQSPRLASNPASPSRYMSQWQLPRLDREDGFQYLRQCIGQLPDRDRSMSPSQRACLEGDVVGRGDEALDLDALVREIQALKTRVSFSINGSEGQTIAATKTDIDSTSLMNERLEGVRREVLGIVGELSGHVLQLSVHCQQESLAVAAGLQDSRSLREEFKEFTQTKTVRSDALRESTVGCSSEKQLSEKGGSLELEVARLREWCRQTNDEVKSNMQAIREKLVMKDVDGAMLDEIQKAQRGAIQSADELKLELNKHCELVNSESSRVVEDIKMSQSQMMDNLGALYREMQVELSQSAAARSNDSQNEVMKHLEASQKLVAEAVQKVQSDLANGLALLRQQLSSSTPSMQGSLEGLDVVTRQDLKDSIEGLLEVMMMQMETETEKERQPAMKLQLPPIHDVDTSTLPPIQSSPRVTKAKVTFATDSK